MKKVDISIGDVIMCGNESTRYNVMSLDLGNDKINVSWQENHITKSTDTGYKSCIEHINNGQWALIKSDSKEKQWGGNRLKFYFG